MGGDEGDYCQVCGCISPAKVTTKRILVGGTEIGINKLDEIIGEVRSMRLTDDAAVTAELLRLTRKYNYVPTKRSSEYGEALLRVYKSG